MSDPLVLRRRCAIYTRKSTLPPFGQEVSSLETQRALCSSFLASQVHRGWVPVEAIYDDSAESGRSLDRPALRELLADIEAGLVDVVLVYKMDRITRSLLDFMRLIDFFDRHDVTFVSITQNFDSGDSMGRLVRNILLIFAEFEREMSRDRLRDKRLYLKRSGRWSTGRPPMGYTLKAGKLVVDEVEASTVRRIFEVYLETKRPRQIPKVLEAEGRKTTVRHLKNGTVQGGTVPTASAIYHILENPVYVGEIGRGDQRFKGIHDAIIDRALWDQVQQSLGDRKYGSRRAGEHRLGGLVRDAYGRQMYTVRGINKRAYRSAPVKAEGQQSTKLLTISANHLESVVSGAVRNLLTDTVILRQALLAGSGFSAELDALCRAGPAAAQRLSELPIDEAMRTNTVLIARIEAGFDRVRILLNIRAVTAYLRWNGVGQFHALDLDLNLAKRHHIIDVPVQLYSRRHANWLSVVSNADKGEPNPALVKLLVDAQAAHKRLLKRGDRTVARVAREMGRTPYHFFKLIRLNYLAPDIKIAIVDGTHPPHLNRSVLLKATLPLDWAQQRLQLGFPPVSYNNGHLPA